MMIAPSVKTFLLALTSLVGSSSMHGQLPAKQWSASSTTAIGVTGDITTSPAGITIAKHFLPLHLLGPLQGDDLVNAAKALDMMSTTGIRGAMYSLVVPPTMKFKESNTLCGPDAVRFAIVVILPAHDGLSEELSLGMFSGSTMPDLRPEVLGKSTAFCGSYGYAARK